MSEILSPDSEIVKCMHQDAKFLLNMIEQYTRGIKGTDYIKPIYQDRLSCIEESAKSILNHVNECNEKGWLMF